jgi:hypothetical protein
VLWQAVAVALVRLSSVSQVSVGWQTVCKSAPGGPTEASRIG